MRKFIVKFGHLLLIVITISISLITIRVDYSGSNYLDSMRSFLLSRISWITHGTTTGLKNFFWSHNKLLTAQIEESNTRSNMLGLYVQSVINENNALKKLLNYTSSNNQGQHYVTTRVIGHISSLTSAVVLINAGSAQGVMAGQAVINENGLIGKVTRVFQSSAEVMLITDSKFRMPIIMRDSGEHAIFSGSTLNLSFTSKQPKVFEGEMAMTMGDDKVFPSYIPVGVARVSTNALGLTTYVEIFVDIKKLNYVLVVMGKDPV